MIFSFSVVIHYEYSVPCSTSTRFSNPGFQSSVVLARQHNSRAHRSAGPTSSADFSRCSHWPTIWSAPHFYIHCYYHYYRYYHYRILMNCSWTWTWTWRVPSNQCVCNSVQVTRQVQQIHLLLLHLHWMANIFTIVWSHTWEFSPQTNVPHSHKNRISVTSPVDILEQQILYYWDQLRPFSPKRRGHTSVQGNLWGSCASVLGPTWGGNA